MKAFGLTQAGDVDTLKALDLPTPQASGTDLLVQVKAVSVNPVDTKVRGRAAASEENPCILGFDAAGVVVAVGDRVTDFEVGDEVWYAGDLTRPGSNAEFQLVEQAIVGHKPKSLSFAEAAALPLTTITAWELLFDRLRLDQTSAYQSRDLLVIGAAGGVGSILLQLAKRLTSVRVIATASRPETQAWARELGADLVIDHRNPLSEELDKLGIDQVDDVISLTHTDSHFDEIVKVIAPQGQIALIDDPAELNVMPLKRKSVSLHWELMFTRSMFQTADRVKQQQLLNRVSTLVDEGAVKTTLDQHFGAITLDNIKRAHTLLESNKAKGKIVLEGFE
ncbi:zinc-binding alcohol dehydrogenase family protein [Ferrimonas marina]|uniref:Zinc-type alcohol dehydrogenase-like protein n=1 Tax=Ferrimonas marina TaxID=299255 RepID=A0A1M5RXA8_9GAMM|nr:zinc-binding alcohol dehydrogenase family protein [Ferrimonas marina]SHH30886.1 NADPH2:quinone reductase [Ferrimonas marina]